MKQTQEAVVDTQSHINVRNVLMWLCAAVFYGYQFILRVSPSVMTAELQNALSIEACALGALTSFYYYGYSTLQIPVGIMLDRIGVRRPLTLASILCLIGCLLFISVDNLMIMAVGRFLMGVGSAFGFLSALKLATLWLPLHRYAFFIGLTLLLGTTGAASAGAPLAFLIDVFGWKETIMIFAVVGAFLATASYTIIQEHPSQKKGDGRSHEFKIFESIMMVLRNPQTWIVGAYGFLMYVPLSGFADLWGVPYIMEVFGVEKYKAAESVSMFYIGVGVGAPFTALVGDYFKSHVKPILYGAFLTFLTIAIALYCTTIPFYLTYFCFLLSGMFSAVQFLGFAVITKVNPSSISATASGIHNTLCMLSGILFQPFIGYLLDYFSSKGKATIPGVLYSSADYQLAILVVPLSLLLSVGFAFFIKESYIKH